MEGARDWRRREAYPIKATEATQGLGVGLLLDEAQEEQPVEEEQDAAQRPAKYFISSDDADDWKALVFRKGDGETTPTPWQPATLVVYGRSVLIPRQHDGVCLWDFSELVHSFGPADYITLASNYHTFVVDNVPILPLSMKNEARRFITFLDALYESRCKLLIRAEASPDDLFFPETRRASKTAIEPSHDGDAVYSETIAEVYQDQTSPFRPNIVEYSESTKAKYNPDQDSDFGTEQEVKVDFANAGAFTGEDERFAYARATSRLWEMCGERWHAREGGWWSPLPVEARHWEASEPSKPLSIEWSDLKVAKGDVKFGPSVELDGPVGLERLRVDELRREGER
jgi:protein AFG1